MKNEEIVSVQDYLRKKFQCPAIIVKQGAKPDMVEVLVKEEFIGTITRDDEEGEVSYNFSMAILDFDLTMED